MMSINSRLCSSITERLITNLVGSESSTLYFWIKPIFDYKEAIVYAPNVEVFNEEAITFLAYGVSSNLQDLPKKCYGLKVYYKEEPKKDDVNLEVYRLLRRLNIEMINAFKEKLENEPNASRN